RGHMVPPEQRWREGGEVRAQTKYDYRISETAAGNPAFATLEPTGGFGAFSRGRGGGSYGTGLRPLPGRGGQGRGRTLPGERLSGDRAPDKAGGERFEPAEASDPRRSLEQAFRDTTASEQALIEQPVGASRPRAAANRNHRPLNLFAFGVSRKRLEQAVRELGVPVTSARELDEADAVVTLRNYYRRKPSALRDAESNGIPIYVLKTNTLLQMENLLASLFDLEADPSEAALRETAEAIGLVQASGRSMELDPQNAYIRRLQHQMAERNNVMSRSRGTEPNRRVELLPDEGRAWR
ncbi:MAG TPA: R3H domain-containing nucleic acid-binding protein, partial [Candidatus Limnocylindria bacterium]